MTDKGFSTNTWQGTTRRTGTPRENDTNKERPPAGQEEKKKKRKEEKDKHSLSEFELERLLGQGAFGMVYLAKHISTGKYCALKQIDKAVTKRMGKNEHAKTEKKILTTAKSPFLLKAILTFQDPHLAWLALEYCPGGDLKDFLLVVDCFEEQESVLYFAEMIMGVHELHNMNYLHRDLKPANFLIDKAGHIKLADFGLAKHKHAVGKSRTASGESEDSEGEKEKVPAEISPAFLEKRKKEIWKQKTKYDHRVTLGISPTNLVDHFKINKPMKKREHRLSSLLKKNNSNVTIKVVPEKRELRRELGHSIVGSPEYMSPEVTIGRHQGGSYYGEEVDWWSLGCVFFEMIFGAPPFAGDSPEELFSEIDLWSQKLPKLFEEHKAHLSPNCYSLLTGFLCDPKHRLGTDINKIKSHPFFAGIDWDNLLSMTPPFVPQNPPEMVFLSK